MSDLESGIEADFDFDFESLDELLRGQSFLEFDGSFGEVKSSHFVETGIKTDLKNVQTPLKVNLKQQLQRQQMEDEQKRRKLQSQPLASILPSSSPAPLTVSTLAPHSLPTNIVQVKTQLLNPTRYHVQQKRNLQIQSFLSQSASHSHTINSLPAFPSRNHISSASSSHHSSHSQPEPDSPLSAFSSSANSYTSTSEVDDLLGDLMGLDRVECDRNLFGLLQPSSNDINNNSDKVETKHTSSISSPTDFSDEDSKTPPAGLTSGDTMTWAKDRIKKDTHNQIERRRRFNINDRIKELGALLPKSIEHDYRQNKGSILKASVDYIKELRKDQQRLRNLEEKTKQQDRQNRIMMMRLQQCELLLKQAGQDAAVAAVKAEPDVMDDAAGMTGDPMLSAVFGLEEVMNF